MTRQSTRIAMFGGLDGRAYRDESSKVLAMRGGYNVELVDNEWWTRGGELATGSNKYGLAGLPWWWLVNGDASGLMLAVSPGYVLIISTQTSKMSPAYAPRATESITLNSGSTSITLSGGTQAQVGDLLMRGSTGFSDEVYCLISLSGLTGTIDRPAITSGAYNHRVIPRLLTTPFAWLATAYANRARGGAVLFEQLVTNATYGLVANTTYLVVTSEYGPPVAINLANPAAAPSAGWFHGENVAGVATTFPATPGGEVCAVVGNRLMLGRATDPAGNNKANTLYYSQFGDLSRWSTGTTNGQRVHNYITLNDPDDSIQNLVTMGDSVVVYRKHSRAVLGQTGKGSGVFQVQYQRDGLGLAAPHAVCAAAGAHYFMTTQGPAAATATEVKLLVPELKQHLIRLNIITGSAFVFWDEIRSRIYFVCNPGVVHPNAAEPPAGEYEVMGGNYGEKYGQLRLAYDIESGVGWLENGVAWVCAGVDRFRGYAFAVRQDGLLVRLTLVPLIGTDAKLIEASATSTVVESEVDTAWMDFGTLEQKQVTRVILSLRVVSDLSWAGIQDYDNADKIQLAALEIFTDANNKTAKFIGDLFVTRGDMNLAAVDSDVLPAIMRFTLTPRVSGQSFRFRLSNSLTATAIAAGRKQGHFRLSGIEVFYDQQESRRPVRVMNAE